jgi:hypothetical protein
MKKRILSITISLLTVVAFSLTAVAGGSHAARVISSEKSTSVTSENTPVVAMKQDTSGTAVTKEAPPVKKEATVKDKTNPKKMGIKGSKYTKRHSLKSKKAPKKADDATKPPEGK